MKTIITSTLLLLGSLSVQAQINSNDSTAVVVSAPQLETITIYELAKGIYCTESYSVLRQSKVVELQKTKNVIIVKISQNGK